MGLFRGTVAKMGKFSLLQLFVSKFHGFLPFTHKFDKNSLISLWKSVNFFLLSCGFWMIWLMSLKKRLKIHHKEKCLAFASYISIDQHTYIAYLKQNKSNYVFFAFIKCEWSSNVLTDDVSLALLLDSMAHELFIEMQQPPSIYWDIKHFVRQQKNETKTLRCRWTSISFFVCVKYLLRI